jgi:DtxR family Mn-dependent transcriptional regulator
MDKHQAEMEELLTATLKAYINAIFCLQRDEGSARVRDIARMLGVHKSTVTGTLRRLAEMDMVDYAPYEPVRLTERGRSAAHCLAERQEVLKDFLQRALGVEPETAERNAGAMEDALDRRVLARIVCFLNFVKGHPRFDEEWMEQFREFSDRAMQEEKTCQEWIEEYLGVNQEQ